MADEPISINLDDLELGEVEEFEEAMGQPFGEVNIESAKAMVHLVWIVKKRDDPKFTIAKARKLKLSQFSEAQNGDEPAPPTQAKPKSKRAGNGRQASGSATA